MSNRAQVIEDQMENYHAEVGFMFDDDFFRKTVELIRSNKESRDIWYRVLSNNRKYEYFKEGRKIYLNLINGVDVSFTYFYNPLMKNSRFSVVELIPDNKFIKVIMKLI